MGRRVWHWIGWAVVFGLFPLVALVVLQAIRGDAPTFSGTFGTGESLLISVAWLAAGVSELRDAPFQRQPLRDFLLWSSVISLCLTSLAYGELRATGSGTHLSVTTVASISAAELFLSVVISTAAVAVGSPGQGAADGSR